VRAAVEAKVNPNIRRERWGEEEDAKVRVRVG